MSLENMNKRAGTSEVDFDALDEVVKEMKYRQCEDALVCELLAETESAKEKVREARLAAVGIKNAKEKAEAYRENVVPAMEALRIPVDKLETIVDKKAWPVPTYGDLVFEV